MRALTTGKPFIVGRELYYISQAVLNGWLQGDGSFTRRCHAWLEKETGCQKALLTHSCTAALEMAAILADIQPGDEVIMPSFTFSSTANAFVLRGGVPVFVDIRPDTLNIDENLVEAAITPRTRAIVAVHYAGVACEMKKLLDIAQRFNLILIEDAAQAILSSHEGKALGTWGSFGCLSFHESKNIISGEGGALLVNDPRYIERAEIIREKGTNRTQFFRHEASKYTWVDVGSSFLPSELVAAFLFAQLENARKIIRHRLSIARSYHNGLSRLQDQGCIELTASMESQQGNGHIVYFLTKTPEIRTALIARLKEQEIGAAFHYLPLHSSPAGIKFGRTHGSLGVTDDISNRLVRLPIFFEMRQTDIRRVLNALASFFNAAPANTATQDD